MSSSFGEMARILRAEMRNPGLGRGTLVLGKQGMDLTGNHVTPRASSSGTVCIRLSGMSTPDGPDLKPSPAPVPSRAPARKLPLTLLLLAVPIFLWSGYAPNGRFNWFMEVVPALIGGAVLVATYRRFPLTDVTYLFIWIFSLVLMIGGHYTYAEVPAGNWMRDALGLSRNHFDRVGHVLQGVVPALVAREIFIRTTGLRRLEDARWIVFLCACVALAISASYELFEWQYAVIFGGEAADDFLGSQGDIWDAQKDMTCALFGALGVMLTFSKLQDRQMRRLGVIRAGK